MKRLRILLIATLLCVLPAVCLAGGDEYWPKTRAGSVAIAVWGAQITSTNSNRMGITAQRYSLRKGSQTTHLTKQIVIKLGAHLRAFQIFGSKSKLTTFKMDDIEAIRLCSDPAYSGPAKSNFQGISLTGKLSDGVFTASEVYLW